MRLVYSVVATAVLQLTACSAAPETEGVGVVRAITKISTMSHMPAMRIAIVDIGEISLKIAVSRDIRCQPGAEVRVLRSKDIFITRNKVVSGPCALKA